MRRLSALALVVILSAAGGLAGCGGDGSGEGDQAQFCERLDRLTGNDPFQAFGDTASPADIEAAFQALTARAGELVDVAPEAARGAAHDYADAAEALDGLLDDAGYVGADVDVAAYQEQQRAYVEAARRLERYLSSEC
jgi:hypothetical protein